MVRIAVSRHFLFWECCFQPLVMCPPGAYRNRYKYLMAMIERLCFSSGREWRKFLQIIEVREWQQIGGKKSHLKTLEPCF